MDIMENFFNCNIDASSSPGFGRFSLAHWCFVLLCFAGLCLFCCAYKKCGAKARLRLRRGLALGALSLALLRAALLGVYGQYGLGTLPLHLCGLAVYVVLFHCFKGGELTGQFLYAFCMPGAAAAILFPDWTYYPALSFMSFCGFALHMLIVAYVLMQALSGDIRPDIRRAPACLGIMLLLALPVYVFDKLTYTNYMFLNWPSPGSPLECFAFLGRPAYLLGYIPLIGLVWAVIYLPFERMRKNKKCGLK